MASDPPHLTTPDGSSTSDSSATTASRPPAPSQGPWWRLHIWQLQPVFDLLVLATVSFLLWGAYTLRAATVPALFALFLAYLLDPMVSTAQRRLGWPRTLTTSLCVLLLVGTCTAAAAWLIPRVIADGRALAQVLPGHLEALATWAQSQGLLAPNTPVSFDPSLLPAPQTLFDGAMSAFGTFASVLGAMAYSTITSAFTVALFMYFSINLHQLPRAERFLPRSRRVHLMNMLGRFEQAFGGFLRGQVVVALFTTTGFLIGFSLLSVPHGPLAALVGGFLSFVPNGQVSGLLLAWLFGLLEAGADVETVPVLVYPSLVYLVTQSLETFLVTPWVQATQTRMHPLLIIAALIAGGSMGGLLGIFLAIPCAACCKIVTYEILVPALRRYAERT